MGFEQDVDLQVKLYVGLSVKGTHMDLSINRSITKQNGSIALFLFCFVLIGCIILLMALENQEQNRKISKIQCYRENTDL